MAGTANLYRHRIADGMLEPDPQQAAAIDALDRLETRLTEPAATPSFWSRLTGSAAQPGIRGVYLHGPVGRGKTLVMDLFFEAVAVRRKRRVHFHAFMLETHRKLHKARENGAGDPVTSVARAIASETRLLCFDEFVVNNIADAMVLGRLYEQLQKAGVTIVATSNFPPAELYKNGLQRDRFLPFIAEIESSMNVAEVATDRDYRRRGAGLTLSNSYFTPIDQTTRAKFEETLALIADGRDWKPVELQVGDHRSLSIPAAVSQRIARFSFDDLFARPVGAADFIALAGHFDFLAIRGLPVFDSDRAEQLRRFMVCVDTVYDAGTPLILLAEAPPDDLYSAGPHAFEFQRTASRLTEMLGRKQT